MLAAPRAALHSAKTSNMRLDSLHTSRRSFLKGMAVTTGGIVLPNILIAQDKTPASRKLGIACIGVTGKGASDMEGASKENEIVAICDVDANSLAKAAAKYPNARQYSDFRKMLDEVKEIEAVTVSTPDHAHYPAAMHAIALGKHVCVQKPLTNTLWEVRELHKAAKKKGVITQMGNQGHTFEGNRLLKEWIHAGAIGRVREVHVWTNRPIWPQGKDIVEKPGTPPDNLDWELWLAATPDHPYSPDIHPFKWRGFVEWGTGALGDMGCHNLDPIFFALDMGMPDVIEAHSRELTDTVWPKGATVKFHWKHVPKHGEVVLYWYEGKNEDGTPTKPTAPWELGGKPLANTGFLMLGTDGVIYNEGDQAKKMAILPEKRGAEFLASPPEKTLPRSPKENAPQEEWTLAIKNGKDFPFMSHFDYSAPLAEFVSLGNLAIRSGQTIQWDAKAMRVTNYEAANRFVKRPAYRPGWV